MLVFSLAAGAGTPVYGERGLADLCYSPFGGLPSAPVAINPGIGYRLIVINNNFVVSSESMNNRHRLTQQVSLSLVAPGGGKDWSNKAQVTSRFVVKKQPNGYGGLDFHMGTEAGDFLDVLDQQFAPVLHWPGPCTQVGWATHQGQDFVVAALGVTAYDGIKRSSNTGPIVGKDLTIMKIVVFDASDGDITNVFVLFPKAGRYLLPRYSKVSDVDGDGNDELVLVHARFVGLNGYLFIRESYNLVTGALERTTTTRQYARSVFQ